MRHKLLLDSIHNPHFLPKDLITLLELLHTTIKLVLTSSTQLQRPEMDFANKQRPISDGTHK